MEDVKLYFIYECTQSSHSNLAVINKFCVPTRGTESRR